jgi:pimeloyl-ACP methyl ester carboxylesterase
MDEFFSYKGSKIHYQINGQGPSLVLLHGFLENLTMWDSLARVFAHKYRVIRLDFPGFGESESLVEDHSMDAFSEVLMHLLKEIHISNFQCVGHSMGGYVALSFLEKYPLKIRHLCLFHSTAFPDTTENIQNRSRTIKSLLAKSNLYFRTAILALFDKTLHSSLNKEIEIMIEQAKILSKKDLISTIEGMKHRKNQGECLRIASCKKTYVAGILDTLLDFDSLKIEAKNHLALFVPIRKAGHMSHLENPEEAQRVLSEVLQI